MPKHDDSPVPWDRFLRAGPGLPGVPWDSIAFWPLRSLSGTGSGGFWAARKSHYFREGGQVFAQPSPPGGAVRLP